MKVITYTIELMEPVLVTALEGDPNSSVSHNYLPGSALRGLFVGRYLRKHVPRLDLTDDQVRRLFFNGQSCYLNGYLQAEDDRGQQTRTVPIPRSWHKEKDTDPSDSIKLFDFAVNVPSQPDLMAVGERFCVSSPTSPMLFQPKRQLAIHTARNRRYGRARRGGNESELSGAVFQYESLAPGQTFTAYILCQDEDEEVLTGLIEGIAQIGGSRTGGYGRMRPAYLKTEDAGSWQEAPPPNQDTPSNHAIITLLSDLILRDGNGQHSGNPRQVAAALGGTLDDAYIGISPTSGFNRKWGLPLPQTPVFQMGSVFVLNSVDSGKLSQALANGLGERRVEGFGRLALNWHTTPSFQTTKISESGQPHSRLLDDDPSRKLAQQMANRMLAQKLERQIGARAAELAANKVPVHKSQLYRLRALFEDELRQLSQTPDEKKVKRVTGGRKRIHDYLDGLNQRSGTKKQFEKARLSVLLKSYALLDWIAERVDDTDEETTRVSAIGVQKLPKVGKIVAEWNEVMTYCSNLRLVNAVLAHLAKAAGED